MFLTSIEITPSSSVQQIVTHNHRTVEVFKKFNIEYCCGSKWPLETVCLMKGLDFETLKVELLNATKTITIPSIIPFKEWNVDFLTDYIINIHHYYLKQTLPLIENMLNSFIKEHEIKYPYFKEIQLIFTKLKKELLPHLAHEEDIVFPYVKQVVHAHESNDNYAVLLVKTLRKPIDFMVEHEQDVIAKPMFKIRALTNNYFPPHKSCVSHQVMLHKLKELDEDLMQHIYLENEILFPKALAIEKQLLA
jgi:regulator of cell morphogenesis and NO signaling